MTVKVKIAPEAIQKLKREAGTFNYIQYFVQDGTEHVPDAAHYSTHSVISDTEDTSANHHGVHKANVSGSWGEMLQMTHSSLCQKVILRC